MFLEGVGQQSQNSVEHFGFDQHVPLPMVREHSDAADHKQRRQNCATGDI